VFWGEAIQGQVFGEINGLIGNEAAAQIQEVIKDCFLWQNHFLYNCWKSDTTYWCHYRFGIQDSINMIWNLKQNQKVGLNG
jgi:membrane protein